MYNKFLAMVDRFGHEMGRHGTWLAAGEAANRIGARRLIETGCFRGQQSDGYSTLILAYLARALDGHLWSYELSADNIEKARAELQKFGLTSYVTMIQGDSVENLAKLTEKVDFAYLDSYDCGSGPDYSPCKKHQLAEFEALLPMLSKRAVILMDDNVDPNCNKVDMSVKRMKQLGFKTLEFGYQVLMETEDSQALPKSKFAVLCAHSPEYAGYCARTIYHNKAQYCLRHGYDLRVMRSLGKYADPKSHAKGLSWARLEEMLRLVESGKYEWVWCVGGDTLITNMGITLESLVALAETPEAEAAHMPECPPYPISTPPKSVIQWQRPKDHVDYGRKHVIICGERITPTQADSFLVRCSKEGAAWIKDILDCYEQYKHHPWVENQAMTDLRWKHAAITYTMPSWRLNCVDFSKWYHISDVYRDGTDCFGNRMQWIKGDFLIHWPAHTLEERMKLLPIYEKKVVE